MNILYCNKQEFDNIVNRDGLSDNTCYISVMPDESMHYFATPSEQCRDGKVLNINCNELSLEEVNKPYNKAKWYLNMFEGEDAYNDVFKHFLEWPSTDNHQMAFKRPIYDESTGKYITKKALDCGDALQLVMFIDKAVADGKDIIVHCRSGKSISYTIARYIFDTYITERHVIMKPAGKKVTTKLNQHVMEMLTRMNAMYKFNKNELTKAYYGNTSNRK